MMDIKYEEHLNEIQKGIVIDALAQARGNRDFHGLCFNLPMGSGKTRTMAITGLNLYSRFLVICSKTLLGNWVAELRKIFGSSVKWEVVHRDYIGQDVNEWIPRKNTRIVLTTPEMVSRSYEYHNLDAQFVVKKDKRVYYKVPRKVLGPPNQTGPEQFHSIKWEGVVIDESQNYTNCKTRVCHAMSALCCNHRWLLSGTPLQEPKAERVLGFFMLLNQTRPDNLRDCQNWMDSGQFPGLARYSLTCAAPQIETRLVSHEEIYDMSRNERMVYHFMQKIVMEWFAFYRDERARLAAADPILRKIRGHLLSLLTYLRLSLVYPRMAMERLLAKIENEATLQGLKDRIDEVRDLLEEIPNSSSSSRLRVLKKTIEQHPEQKILVFGSFVSSLELAMDHIVEHSPERECELLVADMSSKKRMECLDRFRESKNGILFMTYQIGSEGLNLQEATVTIYLDLYWNHGKQQQALARCYRTGQTAGRIDEYRIISNTGFEKGLLTKHREKLQILRAINDGGLNRMRLSTIGYSDMVGLLERDQVQAEVQQLRDEVRVGMRLRE